MLKNIVPNYQKKPKRLLHFYRYQLVGSRGRLFFIWKLVSWSFLEVILKLPMAEFQEIASRQPNTLMYPRWNINRISIRKISCETSRKITGWNCFRILGMKYWLNSGFERSNNWSQMTLKENNMGLKEFNEKRGHLGIYRGSHYGLLRAYKEEIWNHWIFFKREFKWVGG